MSSRATPLAASGTSVPGAGPPPVAGAPAGVPDALALVGVTVPDEVAEALALGVAVVLWLAEGVELGVCDAVVELATATACAARPDARAAPGKASDAASRAAPTAAAIPAAAGPPAARVTVTDRATAGPFSG